MISFRVECWVIALDFLFTSSESETTHFFER